MFEQTSFTRSSYQPKNARQTSQRDTWSSLKQHLVPVRRGGGPESYARFDVEDLAADFSLWIGSGIDVSPASFEKLMGDPISRQESAALIEEFLRVAYNDHPHEAEDWTAQVLERLSDWEPRAELLSALTDFHIWPTTDTLKSAIREQLSDENALVFIAAAQLMVRGKIAFGSAEESLSEKRRAAVEKLREQFP